MWCVAPLEMNEGNSLGQGYNRPTGCSAEMAPHATFLPVPRPRSGILLICFPANILCECLLYTSICTNKWCKFILQLLRPVPVPVYSSPHARTHTHTHTNLTRNYICIHNYQDFVITTHYYILFYQCNNS